MRGAWVYLVCIAILCIAGGYIAHLRLSDIPDPAIGHSFKPPSIGKPREKVVEYRLNGPIGATVAASYLDTDGTVREVSGTLPWQTTLRTGQLTIPTGVVAQATAGQMSCSITINGEVRDEKSSDSSAVSCQVVVA
ncbi:MmpS family transport accessory protein [Mycobacteroides salmoniphilum]|uniref:Putative membrane protein mmpS4 n=1 Tax=Mycobacteroides salmoniphilum TaxID=404941 RepID=A0A4R8SQE6_9MYCO|nr:MmpS family transport accessory protein [Mycobacteroides salmoniphilum]TDZ91433.1 putative membrane protein mmpS4 [Mycobacteroides salmoniphilum]TEA01310.1 putative membrane protein mmpS4 [Mycobacteroides salmoniphilum]